MKKFILLIKCYNEQIKQDEMRRVCLMYRLNEIYANMAVH
jgi:hypothetical protein